MKKYSLALALAAAALATGQRCPSAPSGPEPEPCPAAEFTRADVDGAYARGFGDGRDACPAPEPEPCPTCPEPEPCPARPDPEPCDVTTNDGDVADRAVSGFVRRVLRDCSFGPSVVEAGDVDREVKRRISNLHRYGYCR